MGNNRRLARSIYILLVFSSVFAFMLALGWTISVSAHDLREGQDLVAKTVGPAKISINNLSYTAAAIKANELESKQTNSNPSPLTAHSPTSSLPTYMPSDVSINEDEQLSAECPTPLAITNHLELDLCIQAANASTSTTSLALAADIVLTSTLTAVDNQIILEGNDHFVDGSNSYRVFEVTSNGSLDGYNITIQNGSSFEGGGILNTGTLSLTNSLIVSNTGDLGGGITNASGGTVTLSGSTLQGNSADVGGGIYNRDPGSSVILNNTYLLTNTSDIGGGGIQCESGASCTLNGSTLQGNHADFGGGVFNFVDASTTLNNSTVQGNSASNGAGIYNFSANLTLNNTDLLSNTDATNGGGILNVESGFATLTGGTIQGNTGSVGGGILNNIGSTLSLINTHFYGNIGEYGGGGIYNEGNGAIIKIDGATFERNSATNFGGGAINNIDSALAILTDTHFINNTAAVDGGAINNTDVGTVIISGGTLHDNSAAGSNGGALFNSDVGSLLLLNDVDVLNNSAGMDGGGIHNTDGASVSVYGGSMQGNSAANGGGIYLDESAFVTVNGALLANNTASSNGGGISVKTGATADLTGATLHDNSASSGGGMAAESGGLIDLIGSTLHDNIAAVSGGGILISATSSLAIVNSTISGNSSSVDGGAILNQGTTLITSTTIASNTATSGTAISTSVQMTLTSSIVAYSGGSGNCAGSFYDAHFNLSSDDSCGFNATISLPDTDPLLLPLQDNGGETWTHALLSGTLAINHIPAGLIGCGTSVAADQRGVPRPTEGWCEIGAFEFQVFSLTVVLDGSGSGLVTGNGIECGGDCTDSYPETTAITLTAAPTTGSTFDGWSGACSGSDDCAIIMTESKSVTATFDLEQHQLNVSIAGTGTGSVTSDPLGIACPGHCSELIDYGTVITLTALAGSGSVFDEWRGACTGSVECAITITETNSVTATFTIVRHELVAFTSGNGSGAISSNPPGINCPSDCTELFNDGTEVTLTATADITSTFVGWEGACTGIGECTITMLDSQNVTATFSTDQYPLDVAIDGDGSGTVTSDPAGISCLSDCFEIYDNGTVVTLTAASDTGSTFTGWQGACTGSGECSVTMTETKSVTATFTLDQYLLFVTVDGDGSGGVTSEPSGIDCLDDCEEQYNYGTLVTLTSTADTGSTFTGWDGACTGTGECSITMTETQSVTATFTLDQYLLSIAVEGEGGGLVTSVPSGIDCPDGCDELFNYGVVVTLTAIADSGSTFGGWTGACAGTNDCVVTLDMARNVTATFEVANMPVYIPIIRK